MFLLVALLTVRVNKHRAQLTRTPSYPSFSMMDRDCYLPFYGFSTVTQPKKIIFSIRTNICQVKNTH